MYNNIFIEPEYSHKQNKSALNIHTLRHSIYKINLYKQVFLILTHLFNNNSGDNKNKKEN